MKKLALLLGCLFSMALTKVNFIDKEVQIAIVEDSELLISGSTNINRFNCKYNIKVLNNPFTIFFKKNNQFTHFETATLELENECFDCGHKGMNKDFKKLLKTEQYPKVKLKLLQIAEPETNSDVVRAQIQIFIAGNNKKYWIPVIVEQKEEDFTILGELDLCLSDFNLEAPKKALGIIVVDNQFQVKFKLKVEKDS